MASANSCGHRISTVQPVHPPLHLHSHCVDFSERIDLSNFSTSPEPSWLHGGYNKCLNSTQISSQIAFTIWTDQTRSRCYLCLPSSPNIAAISSHLSAFLSLFLYLGSLLSTIHEFSRINSINLSFCCTTLSPMMSIQLDLLKTWWNDAIFCAPH